MANYSIKNVTKNGDNISTFLLSFGDRACYFYESLDNKFVNSIDVVMDGYRVKKIENHKIYIFFKNSDDINNISQALNILNKEYNNLRFNFRGINNEWKLKLEDVCKRLNLVYEFINKDMEKKKPRVVNNYKDYDISDNPILKKEEDEKDISDDLIRDYANYNGYNQDRVDKSAKNIVSYRFNKSKNTQE